MKPTFFEFIPYSSRKSADPVLFHGSLKPKKGFQVPSSCSSTIESVNFDYLDSMLDNLVLDKNNS